MTEKTKILLNGQSLTLDQVHEFAFGTSENFEVGIDPTALEKMKASKAYVNKIVEKGEPVYGINTGFGALANMRIEKEDLSTLQYNLIRSHCTGVGEHFDRPTTRAIMLIRANCLATGFSGVSIPPVELLIDFLNNDIYPAVPCKGSVGASGDLAPLSHIALALIGEGEVYQDGKLVNSQFAIDLLGKKPVTLGPKDGLALINGTAVMLALGCVAVKQAENLAKAADLASCMSVDGLRGTSKAYSPLISSLKPHAGQLAVCHNLNAILEGSEIIHSHDDCGKVQDPYSLRCVPQVHGSCRQTIKHAREIFSTELNSVTDNPLIFVEDDLVISGGNFHGEALALALDYLAMGVAELCSISERRIEKMMNPHFSDLPSFLVKSSGLNSGLMIAHVTAAALTSENKIMCHPASVDSVPTSTDKEDHVSMGVSAGRKVLVVLENLSNILAIEILANTQAIEYHRPLKSSPVIEELVGLIRKHVPFIENDRVFYRDMENIRSLLDSGEFVQTASKKLGVLQ